MNKEQKYRDAINMLIGKYRGERKTLRGEINTGMDSKYGSRTQEELYYKIEADLIDLLYEIDLDVNK